MKALKIEILNPKALQLINDLQALDLIKILTEPALKLRPKASPLNETQESEESIWNDFAANNFLKGYGDTEPEYSVSDIKEPNPEFCKP